MSESTTAPLVPGDVDLRDFSWMPIEIHRLRRSKAWLICKRKPELAFYMINLWTAAWHDTPAGSLEDDDDVLADLAMCEPSKWAKVREQVLRGWVKCSDGRLYHPVVADKAKDAWSQKQAQRQRTEAARLAREQKRQQTQQQSKPAKPTVAVAESVTDIATESNRTEQNGEGEGEGTETLYSAPDGADAAASPAAPAPGKPEPALQAPSPVDTIFALGLPLLQQANVADRNARTFLGHLRKIAKDRGGDTAVVRALQRCVEAQAVDPVTFLQGCFKPETAAVREVDRAAKNAEAERLLFGETEVIDA